MFIKSMYLPMLIGVFIHCQAFGAVAVDVRALALAGENLIPERYVKVAEGYQRLTFSKMQPSALIKDVVAGGAVLPLFGLVTSPDGRATYQMVDQIKFPGEAKGLLLLAWGSADGARYLTINDDYLSAKYNNWLLINASPKPIAFIMGRENKPIAIKPNAIINHQINAQEGVGIDVVAQSKWGDKVKTFYSTYWPILGRERGIVVFYQRGDRIAVKKITDVLLMPKNSVEASASR